MLSVTLTTSFPASSGRHWRPAPSRLTPSSSSHPFPSTVSEGKTEEKIAEPQTKTAPATAIIGTSATSWKEADSHPDTGRRPINTPPPPCPQPASLRPRKSPSFFASICRDLDKLIHIFMDPPVLHRSVDPHHVLSGNFAPVDELPPTTCPVVRGAIPRCLAGGAYIRNGPNPQHLPRGPYHLFEGDGMLHSLLLASGGDGTDRAILCSRYVCTYKYLLERDAGGPVLPNILSGFHGFAGVARGVVAAVRVLTGQMNLAEGIGLANTSLVFFGGRLYALGEPDLPYAVSVSLQDGEITTLGRCDFAGRVSMGMTAHPKKDPSTGELFAFRYGPIPPFLTYFRFDANGNKAGPDVPIFSVRQPSFLHDFAVTERYAVFADIQIVMKPMNMVLGGGGLVGSDNGKVPRIGVLPRYATSEAEMRWFEVPGFNPLHTINAWEEKGDLILVAPNILSVEHALKRMELMHASMEMVRIELEGGGAVTRTPLSAANLELGVIHPGYVGRRTRYVYLGVADPLPKISGVVKLDLAVAGNRDCVVARRDFGRGCFGGEPLFVPKGERKDEAEDEGYLVSYVHDEDRGESRFLVMDAQSPELEIVAEVLLPRRVPYGFHGIFVSREELESQWSL
ncbi:zeaxanthin 7,8(7',8')-cleavage dioxygenase, chromoplastic-like [Zingiber officinale]|uniref:Uncharacterized protein n=1 Tax=Zingiber officinale TaxID=94328 RepID=A0A8J5EYZ2_ZINOF|nr:zeaxanthin 7,8(7',8')-cleavage dioxygenase, chromoplastic-like [Zingiber officinale]KAG6477892.1 hypothetical protein ZIOFF_061324 [Zingiber officinale]